MFFVAGPTRAKSLKTGRDRGRGRGRGRDRVRKHLSGNYQLQIPSRDLVG